MIEFDSFCDGRIANCGIDGMNTRLTVLRVDGPKFCCSAAPQDDLAFIKDVEVVLCEIGGAAVVTELAD